MINSDQTVIDRRQDELFLKSETMLVKTIEQIQVRQQLTDAVTEFIAYTRSAIHHLRERTTEFATRRLTVNRAQMPSLFYKFRDIKTGNHAQHLFVILGKIFRKTTDELLQLFGLTRYPELNNPDTIEAPTTERELFARGPIDGRIRERESGNPQAKTGRHNRDPIQPQTRWRKQHSVAGQPSAD